MSVQGRIETYRKRAARRQDIWTGRPLTDDDYRYAMRCCECRSWFWTTDDKTKFQQCSDACRKRWNHKAINCNTVKQRQNQVLKAMNELGAPASSKMISQQIAAYGDSWAMSRSVDEPSRTLITILFDMRAKRLIAAKGDGRTRRYVVLCKP